MSLAVRYPGMYDTILVPTDGSDGARRAVEHAALVAGAVDATLHVVTVVDIDGAAGPFSAGGIDDDYVERLRAGGRETAAETAALVDDAVTVDTEVLTGNPADAILDYLDEYDVDMVCMGTHGRRGLQRYLTGSVAERVLRHAPVPVLTVRTTPESEVGDGYDEILVPTDGSDRAEAAVAHALALGERFDSRIHAVSVVNVGDIPTGSESGLGESLLSELKSTAGAATQRVAEEAEAAGLTAATSVTVGRPKGALLSYVEDHDVDLVCMGTHGRTGLDRVLVGSTAEALVRRSPVPVLTVSAAD
jgi:nucleotide-binding universal stress UspA family protein